MDEILCFDVNGNSIDKLAQWDTNLVLYINWEYSVTPIFHFCNTNSKRILVIKGEIDSGNKTAKANIPNILLQEASPLVVFVYMEKETPTGYLTGETIYSFQIPVREKAKPEDYKYFENTEYISWFNFKKEIVAFKEGMTSFKEDMEYDINSLVKHGEATINDYENALAQFEAIKNDINNTVNISLTTSEKNMEEMLNSAEQAEANAIAQANTATTNATTATQQAEIASAKASEAREDAIEIASNVVIVQNYVEQAKKYAEQSREASDIIYLEERVSKLENDIATLEEVKAYLGI